MNHADTPVYQTVIEKSRGLLFRSQAIASAIEIRAGASFLPALSLFLLVQIANYLELLIAAGGDDNKSSNGDTPAPATEA